MAESTFKKYSPTDSQMRVWALPGLGVLRESYGSQADFVEVLKIYEKNITLSAYQKYETGQRSTPLHTAVQIAGILGENVYKLFRAEE